MDRLHPDSETFKSAENARLQRADHLQKLYSRADLCPRCSALTFSDFRDKKGFLFCEKAEDLFENMVCPLCYMVRDKIVGGTQRDDHMVTISPAPVYVLPQTSEDGRIEALRAVCLATPPQHLPEVELQSILGGERRTVFYQGILSVSTAYSMFTLSYVKNSRRIRVTLARQYVWRRFCFQGKPSHMPTLKKPSGSSGPG
jgi:hypothetical protein